MLPIRYAYILRWVQNKCEWIELLFAFGGEEQLAFVILGRQWNSLSQIRTTQNETI